MKALYILGVCLGLAAVLALPAGASGAQGQTETPPVLKASQFLPAKLLSGPSHKVKDKVVNDGYLNRYELTSRFGNLTVVSTALLLTRINEIGALEKMEKLDTNQEFHKSLAQGGEKVVTGATNLINDPGAALDSAVSGVSRMFKRASESIRSKSSKHQDSATETLLGVSKTKREYALQFGVDPYSTNPYLQKRLNEIAQAGQAGGITATALKVLIPGGIGLAVSTAGGSQWLKEVDLSLPPTDLRMQNREKLLGMGLPTDLVEAFINVDDFTPSQQAILVAALKSMQGVKGKDLFLRLTLTTEDQDLALFRQRMAQMYAGYHRKVGKLASFVSIGRFVAAREAGGKLIFAFPLDYLVWNDSNREIVGFFDQQAKALGAPGKELWLSGQASPMTRQKLKERGWRLNEKSESLLN